MNIEDYREYCLSLGVDVEEKLPFTAFHHASGVLVFYVHGHMFSFFDCDNYGVITLKCQPDRIDELKVEHSCIGKPFNMSPKHWIGIDSTIAPDDLLREPLRPYTPFGYNNNTPKSEYYNLLREIIKFVFPVGHDK